MKPIARLLVALLLVAAPASAAQQRPIGEFFDAFTDEWMRFNTDSAASARYFTGAEQERVERLLAPQTREYALARIALARKGLAELRRYDRTRLTPQERVSANLMEWQLDILIKSEPFLDLGFPLEQFGGANIGLPNTLTVQHVLRTEKDADNYLARLALVGPRMNEAIAEARRGFARNIRPPRFILEATISQMEQFAAGQPSENPLSATFNDKLRTGKVVTDARRAEMVAQAQKIVGAEVVPAWQAAIALLKEQLPRASDDAGIDKLPNGAAAYAWHLARFTTTELTADQIHEIGLREVARIEAEMDSVFKKIGRTEGSVKDRIAQLQKDLAYPVTTEGRAKIMADIDVFLADALKRSALVFDRMPKGAVIAQPYPEFRWASAAASYTSPPLDGSRPGIFQMPLRPDELTLFGLKTLVYHETVPGHHFQIALMNEDTSLPKFRQIRAFGGISAITEGWALYAERVAAEEGWYKDDPEGYLGYLDAALFRARRLVVDTGLHTKGWTRQQAIDYGISPSEVERYVVNPGQATSYMIGQLRIYELRERARKALGPKFSLKAFHNTVLAAGALPLSLMEAEVDAYIKAASGG
ncbi:MAG: DUF885 family protein [Rhodospirillaceae bacterium]